MTKENKLSPTNYLLKATVLLGILLLVFLGYFREITAINQDLGRHLLTGQIIWESKAVLSTNLYSYTYPDFPFINHHWFSEVIFYLLQSFFGFPGLLLTGALLMVISFGLLITFNIKKIKAIPLLFLALLYLSILFERTDLRPEIFSYLFLSLHVVILFTYRKHFTKWIYALPFLSLLWVNSHIYFPIGLLLIFLFFIDSLIINRDKIRNQTTLTLFSIGIICSVITLLNPHGLTGALYPLSVFRNYGYTIEENQTLFFLHSLGFHKSSFAPFLISVFLLFISLLFTLKRARPIDWLLSIIFTFLAFSAVRNFPLFVFATFIPLQRAVSLLFTRWQQKYSNSPPLLFYLPHLLSIIAICLLLPGQFTTLSQRPRGAVLPQGASNALTFFKKSHIRGPIFNNFDIGSYISYRLYPQEKVFIDGRPEAYPSAFIQKSYIPMQEKPEIFAAIEKKYQFNAIIFSHTDQTPWAKKFIKDIVQNKNWVPVYLDPMVIILLKNIPSNTQLIHDYGMMPSTLKMQYTKLSIQSLYQGALFFHTAMLPLQEQDTYRKILSLDPKNCTALAQLALSEQQQNPLTLQRYSLYCL